MFAKLFNGWLGEKMVQFNFWLQLDDISMAFPYQPLST
jgi:hypothetical protein